MRYCLFVLSLFVVVASCKKVETSQSRQEKLRAVQWVIDTAYVTYLSATGSDSDSKGVWPEQFIDGNYVWPRPGCLFDDYLKFEDNNDGVHVTGPSKCNVSETDNIDFKWGVFQGDTKMYIYGMYAIFGEDVTADIQRFEDNKFTIAWVKQTGPTTAPQRKRITYKFKKK
jgi:hypothetical protein